MTELSIYDLIMKNDLTTCEGSPCEPDADEIAQMDSAYVEACAESDREYTLGQKLWSQGLRPIDGCCCFGGNTPELIGHCCCQGIDHRTGWRPAPAGWNTLENAR